MKGYQISFFTQLDKKHHGRPLGDWLVHVAKEMGLPGATLLAAAEGFGHSRRIHSMHFFELTAQSQEVILIATEQQADALFARLRREAVSLFYAKTPVEFGVLGEDAR